MRSPKNNCLFGRFFASHPPNSSYRIPLNIIYILV